MLTVILTMMSGFLKKTEMNPMGRITIFGLNPMLVGLIGFAIGFYLGLRFSN